MSMIAMEVMLCHWDGYALNKNNWRLFHDLDSNRMVFIPHGVDQTFGVGQHREGSILPPMSGVVASTVLSTAEGRKRYRQKLSQLYTNVLRTDEIFSRIDEVQAELTPALSELDSSAARNQEHQAAWLKQRILRRSEDLRRQLDVTSTPFRFGSDGQVRLTGWKPSPVRLGTPMLAQGHDAATGPVLKIVSRETPSKGSWRNRVVLSEGSYSFEGRVRVRGVEVDPNSTWSGAGLRISNGQATPKLTGTTEWTNLKYEFEVEDEVKDVELICELSSLRGEAWFDVGSLRLVRLR
jgi:hypothetical protein